MSHSPTNKHPDTVTFSFHDISNNSIIDASNDVIYDLSGNTFYDLSGAPLFDQIFRNAEEEKVPHILDLSSSSIITGTGYQITNQQGLSADGSTVNQTTFTSTNPELYDPIINENLTQEIEMRLILG